MQSADFTVFSGTETCYPPEWFKNNRYKGEELDFWGAALVLYKIIEGIIDPFITADDIMHKPLPLNKSYTYSFKFFILGALDKHREMRIKFETVWDEHWMTY